MWVFPKIGGNPPKSSIKKSGFPLFSPSILGGKIPLFLVQHPCSLSGASFLPPWNWRTIATFRVTPQRPQNVQVSEPWAVKRLPGGGVYWWDMGVSKNNGTPKWMVKIMENPIKMDDLGVPLFLETHIWRPASSFLTLLPYWSPKFFKPTFVCRSSSEVSYPCDNHLFDFGVIITDDSTFDQNQKNTHWPCNLVAAGSGRCVMWFHKVLPWRTMSWRIWWRLESTGGIWKGNSADRSGIFQVFFSLLLWESPDESSYFQT